MDKGVDFLSEEESTYVGKGPPSHLRSTLVYMHHEKFFGSVTVNCQGSSKALIFESGDIVSASSNPIDDRLGEVIYRRRMISIDELTEAASAVDRDTKFGQVLLLKGTFSHDDIWRALTEQVREIVKSCFLESVVDFVVEKNDKIWTRFQIDFEEGTRNLIDHAYIDGLTFQDLTVRLQLDTPINLDALAKIDFESIQGTVLHDLCSLLLPKSTINAFLKFSKLNRLYSLNQSIELMTSNLCKLPCDRREQTDLSDAGLEIYSHLEDYASLLENAVSRFNEKNIPFPFDELKTFVSGVESVPGLFFLDAGGKFAVESVRSMMVSARTLPDSHELICRNLRRVRRYVNQILREHLSSAEVLAIERNLDSLGA